MDIVPTNSLPVAASVEDLLLKAVEHGATVEQLESLMNLRERIYKEHAKREFDAAMARFQAACPTINKSKTVYDKSGRVRYHYAPLDAIVSQTKELIGECGLSYFIDLDQETAGFVKAICTVKHLAGHAEFSTFRVPIDSDAYMSDPQKYASAQTFARRYAFCNAFGIMTGDEDTDNAEQRSDYGHSEHRATSDERRQMQQAQRVDEDFTAPDGFSEFEVVEFYEKTSTKGETYYSYKLRCLDNGKVGWVSCWDANVERASQLMNIPPEPGTKFRAWVRQGKTGYWAIDQFSSPEPQDGYDPDNIDLGPPLDMNDYPLLTPGD